MVTQTPIHTHIHPPTHPHPTQDIASKVLLTRDVLRSNGFLVLEDTAGLEPCANRARFLVVNAPMRLIEQAAEHQEYMKTLKTQPDAPKDALPDYLPFKRAENNAAVYEGYGTSSFWDAAEEAELSVAALETVTYAKDGDATPTAAIKPFLLQTLKLSHALETIAPLHEQAKLKKLWDTCAWSVFAPEDEIEVYFGSRVAFYFAWLNTFTCWLLAPSVLGLACFASMQLTDWTVDDHPYLPFYSFFVVFWAACFTACWKRRASEKAWVWRVAGLTRHTVEVRPEFHGELRSSRVTGHEEVYYPRWKRLRAYCVSAAATGMMLLTAFCTMILSLNLQGYIDGKIMWEEPLYFPSIAQYAAKGAIFDPNQTEYFGIIALIPTMLHVVVIMQLNALYRSVAERLTEWENHRLKEEHENSLILKRFLFESFDCYISLFYLGFVQQDIRKLRLELISLYTVDSLRRAGCETLLPFLLNLFHQATQRDVVAALKKSDASGHLVPALKESGLPEYEEFDDYLEMVIEFGYVTLFASAFPLAAALSVACNFIEMKSDLFKLCRVYRRPEAARCDNIGVWEVLIRAMMWMSICTNTFLFVSSEQLAVHMPWLYRHANLADLQEGRVASIGEADHDLVVKAGAARWVLLVAFAVERLVFFACLLIHSSIPPVSETIATEKERSIHLAQQRQLAERAVSKMKG